MKQFTTVLGIAVLLCSGVLHAQSPPITITWTATLNGEFYPLDSVVITNQSNKKTMTVYYPDTIFEYQNLGINEFPLTRNTLRVYPNPFSGSTQVEFSLAQYGEADLAVYDVLGREILRKVSVLESGTHSYKLSLPSGFYTLRLQTAEGVRTARVVSEANCLNHDFYKINNFLPQSITKDFHKVHKENNLANPENLTEILVQDKGVRGGLHKANNTNFPCKLGDTLVLQCFITVGDSVLTEEHSLPLIGNRLITFAFFKEEPITIRWTAELNCAYYPLDSVVLTNKLTEEKTTFYYPDTTFAYFLSESGDTLILQGFITESDSSKMEEHTISLTKDTTIIFAFLNENILDTNYTNFFITDGNRWDFSNIVPDSLYIINSAAEAAPLTGVPYYPLTIDLDQYTLLLAHGSTNGYGITNFAKNLQFSECGGKLDIGLTLNDATHASRWLLTLLINKITGANPIELTVTDTFIPVRVCDVDDPLTELQWLRDEIDFYANYIREPYTVYQCTYNNGQIGFLTDHCLGTFPGNMCLRLRDCEGNFLCTITPYMGQPCSTTWDGIKYNSPVTDTCVDKNSLKLIFKINY